MNFERTLTMHIDPQSKHGWQALRYAARQLTAGEQAAFENSLAADQAAREAVAQAVELAHTATFLHLESETELAEMTTALRAAPAASTLTAALQVAAPTATDAPQRPTPSTWVAKAGWWSAAAAACVALFALWSPNRTTSNPVTPAPSTERVTSDVTSAWADLNAQHLTAYDPASEVPVEHFNTVRELPRDSDDALVLDWLVNGLRAEGLNVEERGPEIERTN